MNESSIILLEDLIKNKERKEEELKFYKENLQALLLRVSLLQNDISLTNRIIKMIETENFIEIKP